MKAFKTLIFVLILVSLLLFVVRTSNAYVNTFIVGDKFDDGVLNTSIWNTSYCSEGGNQMSCVTSSGLSSQSIWTQNLYTHFGFNSSDMWNVSFTFIKINSNAGRLGMFVQQTKPVRGNGGDAGCSQDNSPAKYMLYGDNGGATLSFNGFPQVPETAAPRPNYATSAMHLKRINIIRNETGYYTYVDYVLKNFSTLPVTGTNGTQYYFSFGGMETDQGSGGAQVGFTNWSVYKMTAEISYYAAPKVTDINLSSTSPSTNCTGNNATSVCVSTTDLSPTFKISLNESVAAGCRMADADVNYTAMAAYTNCTLVNADYCSCTWAGTPATYYAAKTFYFSTISTTGDITKAPIPASNKVLINFTELPVGILRNVQTPNDLNVSNLPSSAVNITFNITNANLSSIILYYNTTSSNGSYVIYTNGTPSVNENRTYNSNISNTFTFKLFDNSILPAIYNIDEAISENVLHTAQTGTNANAAWGTEFLNMNLFREKEFIVEVMVNGTTTGLVTEWYCNSSRTGKFTTDTSCCQFSSFVSNKAYDHCHEISTTAQANLSCHQVTYAVISNNQICGVGITDNSQIFVQCPAGGCTFYSGGLAARTTQTVSTTNGGTTLTPQTYNLDTHLHPINGTEVFKYNACASSPLRVLLNCTQQFNDTFEIGGVPPSPPTFLKPVEGYYAGNINISWKLGTSYSYSINTTNLSLYNSSFVFLSKINDTLGRNTSLIWNTTLVSSDRMYYIGGKTLDSLGQESSVVFSQNFTIDNTGPVLVSNFTIPENGTEYSPSTVFKFNSTWTDATVSVDQIWLTFDGTVTYGNNVSFGPLARGTYSYYWTANDTLGNRDISVVRDYVIQRANSSVNLSVTPVKGYINDSFFIECNRLIGDDLIILYLDGNNKGVGSSYVNYTTALGAGQHNVSCNYDQSMNYSSSSANTTINVTKIPSITSLTISPNPAGENETVDITCSYSKGDAGTTLNITQNGTFIKSGSSPLTSNNTYLAGTYNISCNYPESQNYTISSTSSILTVLIQAIVRNNFNASFNPFLANATYAYVRNGSGIITGLTNLTSYNNPATGQNNTVGLFVADATSIQNRSSAIYFNSSGIGGPARIKCGNRNGVQYSTILNSTYANLFNVSALNSTQVWCWMDYINSTGQYNFTIGSDVI